MNRIIFSLLICLLAFGAQAQKDVNQPIAARLDAFIELTNQKRYSEAFDFMYPKLFEFVSKQDLIDLMTSLENEGMSLHLANQKIISFSSPFHELNEKFVRIDYAADMSIMIKEGSLYDSEKAAMAMLQQFQTAYGQDNVQWDPAGRKYSILVHKAMMAVQRDDSDWYLAEINPDQMDLMRSLFSEAVLRALVNVE